MKPKVEIIACLLTPFVLFLAGTVSAPAQPAGSRETLKQYVADLQKTPNDQALREKIIKLTLSLDPKPAIPEAAEKYADRAEYAFKEAKSPAEYADAAKEYEKALLLAPWEGTNYYNLGVAHEKAGQPQLAIRSFTFYLLATPEAGDAREVRKHIAALEYAGEKATKERTEKEASEKRRQEETATAERRRQEENARVAGSWEGFRSWWSKAEESQANKFFHYEFEIRDGQIICTMVCHRATTEADKLGAPATVGTRIQVFSGTLNGGIFSGSLNAQEPVNGEIIGDTIIAHVAFVSGKKGDIRYVRKR